MSVQERVQKQGETIFAYVQTTRKLIEEQLHLLAVLEMQALVMCQGIDVHDVRDYGYDPQQDKRMPPKKPLFGRFGVQCWREANPVYNYVNLKDGTHINITPVPKPSHRRGKA